MEIKIDIPKEELNNLIDGLNNAYIAYIKIYQSLLFGCETLEPFYSIYGNLNVEELESKFKPRILALLNLYEQLIEIEKRLDK